MEKRKFTWNKNEQNILQGSKIEKCQLTRTKIRKMNLEGPKMKNTNLLGPKTYLSHCMLYSLYVITIIGLTVNPSNFYFQYEKYFLLCN